MEENVESVIRLKLPRVPQRTWFIAALVGLPVLAFLIAVIVPSMNKAYVPHEATSLSRPLQSARMEELQTAAGGPSQDSVATTGAKLRRVIQTATLELRVDDPGKTLEQVRQLVTDAGGYVERSDYAGSEGSARAATVVLRVPAAKLDAIRAGLHRIGGKVLGESVQANDVTAQYVDLEATLKNYRAEEDSYREIMQRSGSIKDTLLVAQQLADVRGRIERAQAELSVMSKQVEMSTITVTLTPELPVVTRVFQWHPLQVVKEAFRDGAESLAGYADTMIAILFRVPAILLWLATWVLAGAAVWKAVRWTWRRLFAAPSAPAAAA